MTTTRTEKQVSRQARIASIVLVVCGMSATPAVAQTNVISSLDGKTVLPQRIRWVAQPGIPRSAVKRVEFRIDGMLCWVEREAPYVYGDDTDRLVTSWLSPGQHRFTVRVVRKHGKPLSHTTTATVVSAPAPPPDLANTKWQHVLRNQGELGSPAGPWFIRISRAGWKIDDPKGGTNFVDVAYLLPHYLAPGVLELRGGIRTRPRSNHEGDGWCDDSNQSVRYRWTVTGDHLELTLDGPKRCGDQATVLSGAGVPDSSGGTWSRVT